MYKYKSVLILSILMHYNADAQSIKNRVVDIVKTNKNVFNIQIVGADFSKIDSTLNSGCSNGSIDFINQNGTIWITQNGSSKVYSIDQNNSITRLDRTCNQGFNYGATNLIYRDTLYSFGGYGFWQTTGSVRFFNPTSGEWDIIRDIENVPIASGINAICYYDKINGKLFVVYTPTKPEYVKIDEGLKGQALLQCFDFKEKKWWNEAKQINPKIATKFTQLAIIQKFDKDILLSSQLTGKVMLINFNENKIKDVDYKYHTELKQLLNSRSNYISYTVNDTVKLLDLTSDKILTSYIKPNQLSINNEPIYINKGITENLQEIPWLVISGIINGILILSIGIGLKIKNNKKQLTELKEDAIVNHTFEKDNRSFKNYAQNLSAIEKDLLHLLYNNHLQNQKTTVTQINKVLGTEKKPFKIQNNIRGEVLTTINNKFMAFAMVSNNLIERQRSDYDKRHMEYYINEKYVSKLSSKLFTHSI